MALSKDRLIRFGIHYDLLHVRMVSMTNVGVLSQLQVNPIVSRSDLSQGVEFDETL